MHVIHGENVNDIYPKIISDILEVGQVVHPRGTTTKELHPAHIELACPWERLVTAWNRPVNVAFMLAEVLWILEGRADVGMLQHYNSNIVQFSDDGQTFNAPYGYRIRKRWAFDQLEGVVKTLEDDPDSRQATIQIWDARSDLPAMKPNTKDRACNLLSHVMIRDGKLDWLQIQRSNDAIWGTPYNWMQFTHLQEFVAAQLHVPMGKFYHTIDSLHIYDGSYESTFEAAACIEGFNLYSLLPPHLPLTHVDAETMFYYAQLEQDMRLANLSVEAALECAERDLPMCWEAHFQVLAGYTLYKQGEDERAIELLLHGIDRVYCYAALRFMWHMRWSKPDWKYHANVLRLIEAYLTDPLRTWVLEG